ncbi:carbamoyltransferase [Nanoarchaeota archaeon]
MDYKKPVFVLGINSAYHEPAACLLKDGKIIAAVEEERFSRQRHGKPALIYNPHELPYSSINYCLKSAGITIGDVSHIGFSFLPEERLKRNIGVDKEVDPGDWGSKEGEEKFYNLLMTIPKLLNKKYKTDVKGKFIWIPHHLSHAASAYFAAPYKNAAILTTDGIGEFASTMLAYGKGNKIKVIKEINYPNSIGFLWTKASRYLGLLVNGMGEYGAGKVMALASYGDPERFYKEFKEFVTWDNNGNFKVDGVKLQFRYNSHSKYEKLFGKSRDSDESVEQRHMDFAAALQKITNEVTLSLVKYLYTQTGSKNLCKAGGVSLNCLSNTHLLEHGPFERIFVQPAANDMGTALGAAFYIWHHILDNKRKTSAMSAYLGTEYSNEEIENTLKKNTKIEYIKTDKIEKLTANFLANGLVIGWFQGRMELGPRALGNRSILADPRNSSMHKKVSIDVKGREHFRPLAPSILKEEVDKWFYRPTGSDSDDFMLFAYKLRPEKIGQVPAITHVDDTARIQTVSKDTNERYYNLIKSFHEITGVPILVNTSFNINSPIVESPSQALDTFLNSEIDVLAMGDYLAVRKGEFDLKLITRSDLSLKKFFEHLR